MLDKHTKSVFLVGNIVSNVIRKISIVKSDTYIRKISSFDINRNEDIGGHV